MQHINSLISQTIESLYQISYSPEITTAPKAELGEYCINIFPIVKTVAKAPQALSTEIAEDLAKHTDIFTSTNATGGYVNFFLTDKVWISLFADIYKNGESVRANKEKTIVVDYIGANVGKPLHIGHICTPSIGQVICNTYRHLGYRVIGDSHFGDWGGIFGKLIWAWNDSTSDFVNEYNDPEINSLLLIIDKINELVNKNIKKKQLEKYWVDYLMKLYQKWFNSINDEDKEKLEKDSRKEFQYLSWIGIYLSDPEERKHHEENVELWKKFTSISIAETEKKLSLLNVEATYNIGESFYEGLGLPRPNNEDYPDLEYTMKDIVRELIEKWVATQNEDGSVGVVFSEESKIPSCILQKKDGTGLYLTSDLAAIKYRLTNGWNPSKIIYSVDVRQQLHLKQAFTIARMAWPELTQDVEFFHAFNGFIKLKEWAMSTRHGTVIFLDKLIEEWNERTTAILEEKGRTGEKALDPKDVQAITIAAIKYSYLAQDREKDVTFDWDKALNFEGNSGPYIQYAYVRACKILKEAGGDICNPELAKDPENQKHGFFVPQNDEKLKLSTHDKSLIQSLARMKWVIDETASKYKPHILALYCYELAVTFNSFYVHTSKILEEQDIALKAFRISLITQTTHQLKLGFELLGIHMPSEM
jgi:arginyl-tRNA synthetase